MKTLFMIALLSLPSLAAATPGPASNLDHVAVTQASLPLAAGPALPFATEGEANSCGMRLDPLPDVLALSLLDPADERLAFCFTE